MATSSRRKGHRDSENTLKVVEKIGLEKCNMDSVGSEMDSRMESCQRE